MQKPYPEDVTGVPVELRVVHPNGEVEWITTVTSDGYGNYAYVYTPPTEGIYKVIATFPGSESYWSSSAESALAVGPASQPSTPIVPEVPTEPEEPEVPTEPEEPEEPTEPEEPVAPLITTELAIILAVVAIAIVGIVAYLVLQRRK